MRENQIRIVNRWSSRGHKPKSIFFFMYSVCVQGISSIFCVFVVVKRWCMIFCLVVCTPPSISWSTSEANRETLTLNMIFFFFFSLLLDKNLLSKGKVDYEKNIWEFLHSTNICGNRSPIEWSVFFFNSENVETLTFSPLQWYITTHHNKL